MKPAAFTYHRPASVEEALQLIADLGDEAKFLAGGQSLVPMMNFRLARPAALVDIGRLASLAYLRREGEALRVGALTTHRAVETTRDPAVLEGFGVLPRTMRLVGHYPIRTLGTAGGSIAHADPSAEWCLLALLLDAQLVARSVRGERVIPAATFFRGFLTTALDADELITEIRFPAPAPNAAVIEFSRRQGDFAVVAAGVSLQLDGDRCTAASIALGGVGAAPLAFPAAAAMLATGGAVTADAIEAAVDAVRGATDPPSDNHGTSDYRRHLAGVLLKRAIAEALGGRL